MSRRRINIETERTAGAVAEEISRFRNREDIFLEAATARIRRALEFYDDLLEQVRSKSDPRTPGHGYTAKGREAHRVEYLKTYTGFGFSCDICGGDFDTKTFMTLRIGSFKSQLLLDLCKPCTIRLSAVVDARLEDGRRWK